MNAVAVVLLVILIGAVLLGLSLARTDVFNPVQAPAYADWIRAQTEALAKANAESLHHQQVMDGLTEAFYAGFSQGSLFIMGLLATMLGLGGTFCLFALGKVMIMRAKRDLIRAENEQLRLLNSHPVAVPPSSVQLAAPPSGTNGLHPRSQRRSP